MIKSRLFVLILIAGLAWIQSNDALAGGFEGPGVGVRALTMGGAFIGLADDWTAFTWNPAGLAQLQGNGGGVSMDYVQAKASDGNSVANSPITAMNTDQRDVFFQYGGEPLAFNKKDVESTVYLPTLGGYTQFKGLTIAGGIYVPMGYASEWTDTVSNVTGTYKIESYETVGNISVAKKVLPNLMLGGGLNLVSWNLEKHAKKTTTAYNYNSDIQADGSDFEGIIGGIYSPLANLRIGFVYKTGSKIDLKGAAKTTYPYPSTSTPPFAAMSEASDLTMLQRLPATYGLGIAWRPMPALVLTMDWNRTDWSKQEDKIDFTTPSQQGFLTEEALGKDKSLGWKDTSKIRLGTEYKLNQDWTLRAGFFTDPSPVPDKAVSLTNLIDLDRTFQVIGAGYSYGNWQFDLGLLYTTADKTIDGVKYERSSDSLHIASSYRF